MTREENALRLNETLRLCAPGYMDCTEWSVFKLREEAEKYLEETFGEDVL